MNAARRLFAAPFRARCRQASRRWPWILYGALLLLILIVAAVLRYRMPQTPLFDGDSWGYLAPAFSKLTGGSFQHTFGRNFVYPGFLFVVLCLGGNYGAICIWQHALGLLTGLLLALAWTILCEFLAVSARARTAARFLGLAVVADDLLSRSALLFEHTIRPEAVFPFFLTLSFVLNFSALHARYVVRRRTLERWCLGLNFVVLCLAQSLKPSLGFAVIAANLPLAWWLVRRDDPWREKWKVTGTALTVAALTLWLPERALAKSDRKTLIFLPTMLFTIHAKIIHQQILDDLRTGQTAPDAPDWLAAFNRKLEASLAAAALKENNPWPTIGFNADYLIYRDSVFDPFFGRKRERELAAFCLRYYWRTWRHRPDAMLGEVLAELGVVYHPPRLAPLRRLLDIADPYTGKVQRPLTYDYRASWACALNEGVHARLVTSRYAQRYLLRLRTLCRTGVQARQFPWVGYLNNWLNLLRLPVVVFALLCGVPLLCDPRGNRLLVGAIWLCLLIDFSMFLTVAVAHTLDIDRYVQNQRACTVFGEFAVLLLPWQWLRRKTGGAAPLPGAVTPAQISASAPCIPATSCLALSQTLVELRHRPVSAHLRTIGEKHSMLHLDVLLLLYHFAHQAEGDILEIGSYLGGATIALAFGVRDSGRAVKLTTVEEGGSHLTHPTLPTDDILCDLKRNLAKREVAAFVTLIEGRSVQPAVISRVGELHAPGTIGLLVIDADGYVERDFSTFRSLLREDCLLVIDDYYAPGSPKTELTRGGIDALVAEGRAEPLGLYGWGTWIGRLIPPRASVCSGLTARRGAMAEETRSLGAEAPEV